MRHVGQNLSELFLANQPIPVVAATPSLPGQLTLGVIGEIGARKWAFADDLETACDALHERHSTRLRALVQRWHIPETRANLQKIVVDLHDAFGTDILTRPILKSVLESRKPLAVVEGLRYQEDVWFLRRPRAMRAEGRSSSHHHLRRMTPAR